MVAECPAFGGLREDSKVVDVVKKVDVLEKSMNNFMKQQNEQMMLLRQSIQAPRHPINNVVQAVRDQEVFESPGKRKRAEENGMESGEARNASVVHESYASRAAENAGRNAGNKVPGIQPLGRKGPRRNSTVMYGKAKTGKDDGEEILCADVDLAVFGVSKDATKEQLKEFIENKGIAVVDIEKLTKAEEARTNTFRVKIKASEYDKAMNPDVWPYRVGVRHYIPPKRNPQNSWQQQSAQSGGRINPQQQRDHYGRQYQGQGQYPQHGNGRSSGAPGQAEHQQQQQPKVPLPGNQSDNGVGTHNRFTAEGFEQEVSN